MKKNLLLAQNNTINIRRCCQGVIHIHMRNGVSLRLTEDAYLELASMIKEASSRLMDEHLADFNQG